MDTDAKLAKLDAFRIETPSWGYADTGTRFGKYLQDAAASNTQEKFEDAATVHRWTGCCPTVAVHVLWDFPAPMSPQDVASIAAEAGIRIGSINANLFQDQRYKLGSVCSPWDDARALADRHVRDCISIAETVGSSILTLWFADGTNYPGQDDLIARKHRMQKALREWHDQSPDSLTLLVEYKPFEPAFYHTDIADWGMSALFCRHAGPRAKVLVDTGHHLPGCNVEHLVAFLLDEGQLGGFHFNDRKYADDDLTLGSIDPYAVFRIFFNIVAAEQLHGIRTDYIAYMVDQSHNLKPKIEAMIQTVTTAQELYVRALGVDLDRLAQLQKQGDIVGAEMVLRDAFYSDVSAVLSEWRSAHGVPSDPLKEYRGSGWAEKLAAERGPRKRSESGSYA